MQYSNVSTLPLVEEQDAGNEIAKIYEEYKREMQIPYVPNMLKGLAVSPAALNVHWDLIKSIYKNMNLPESLKAMILYAIAESKNCQYFSTGNELTCRTLGIDEATIVALMEDIDRVSPTRIREIIKFALKVSHDPQGLVAEDYERVREYGITDKEMVEIILIAAFANYADTIADALKVPVDSKISTELNR